MINEIICLHKCLFTICEVAEFLRNLVRLFTVVIEKLLYRKKYAISNILFTLIIPTTLSVLDLQISAKLARNEEGSCSVF